MKITTKLLERHGMGRCTEEEKKAIKIWFETLDDNSMNLTITPEVNEERIWSKMSRSVPELKDQDSKATILLHHSMTRYAASVCIILVAFFGGRFTAPVANASKMTDTSPKDVLYIYGGDNAEAYVPGNEYKIKFDGRIKLFNSSTMQKRIHVGDTTLILASYQTYFLSGSTKTPELEAFINGKTGPPTSEELAGGFSILRIDNGQ